MLSDSSASGAQAASDAATNLLYSGEQYDSSVDQYYLRARYYNPASGLFNRTDPYAGNPQDPQSLHKYAYCHNNPINGIDPLGLWNTVQVLVVTGIIANLFAIYLDTTRLIKATREGNDIEAFFAKLWLGIDILTLCIPFSGGASLAFAGGRTLTLSVVHIARLRIALGLYRAAATTGDYIDATLDSHGSQPSPRPDGTESHHGVLDKWMKKNFQNYNSNKAPSLLIPKSMHDRTRAVYNTWRTMMRDRMGGAFDWSKVSLSEMKQLSKQMMDAAKVSPEMQNQFWEAFEEYQKTLTPK